jgi:hypothetical protein
MSLCSHVEWEEQNTADRLSGKLTGEIAARPRRVPSGWWKFGWRYR